MTAKTKRRKVWVSKEGAFSERQWSFDPPLARFKTRFEAFVESRPGDVVLSREDVARALALLDAVGGSTEDSRDDLRALLRGGR